MQLVDMIDEQVLPQLVPRHVQVPFVADDLGHATGERFVEEDMAEHDLRIGPADGHAHDTAAAPQAHAPFVGRVLRVLRRVIGAMLVGIERIVDEVVIRRTDVGAFEPIEHDHERRVVVPRRVVLVHDDINAKELLQIEEVLLLVTHDDGDIVDARLLELANLAFDEDLVSYAQEPLGLLVGNRGKARGEPSCEDDRVVDPIRLEGTNAQIGHAKVSGRVLLEVAVLDELANRGIDRTHRKTRALGDRPLGKPRLVQQPEQHDELVLAQCARVCRTRIHTALLFFIPVAT